ncbi:MAG: NarK/NasA family nitrate transporter [Candidatus Nanopelagicales bacterium]|nr:NarK/NasA family nitrate transporter [Candidatus Nanopelagicales bacterium]
MLPGRWIDNWDPENNQQWSGSGRGIARRNLTVSVFAEFLGFCVWALWSIVVPQLPAAGFALTVDQMFWLVAAPALIGATLRIPYTLAVPVFGGRNWTVVSALLLLIPIAGMYWVVQRPDTSFTTLLLIAALAGFGGGNFASSMANISFFFPAREKGWALGLNAAGGNIGTAVIQFVVPIVVITGTGLHLERAALIFLPVIVLAAAASWLFMDNLVGASNDPGRFAAAARDRHTWLISLIYIGTFGSFIGFAVAFPTLLKSQFPEVGLSIAFTGALVGSLARPLGGMLADRIGGARVTILAFAVMMIGAVAAVFALAASSFPLFIGSFLVLFCATGAGNGSVYRMIPAVFRLKSGPDGRVAADKTAAGCIGIAGAVGALGGFLVPRGFAWSTSATGGIEAALWTTTAFYALLIVVTYVAYQRGGSRFGSGQV